MNKAMQALSPKEKLFHIERIHNKLVHLSRNRNVFLELNENGDYLIDNALQAILANLICFNHMGPNKKFINYKHSIENIIKTMNDYRSGVKVDLLTKFCHSHGEFVKFYNKYRRKLKNVCEEEYHNVILPMFELDVKFIRERRLKS